MKKKAMWWTQHYFLNVHLWLRSHMHTFKCICVHSGTAMMAYTLQLISSISGFGPSVTATIWMNARGCRSTTPGYRAVAWEIIAVVLCYCRRNWVIRIINYSKIKLRKESGIEFKWNPGLRVLTIQPLSHWNTTVYLLPATIYNISSLLSWKGFILGTRQGAYFFFNTVSQSCELWLNDFTCWVQ